MKPKLLNLSGKRWWIYASEKGIVLHHQIYIDGVFIRKDKYPISWEYLLELKEKYG